MRLPGLRKSPQEGQRNEGRMSLEPFVYLALFLFVAFLIFIGRWLSREIEKQAAYDMGSRMPGMDQQEPSGWSHYTEGSSPPLDERSISTEPSSPRKPRGVDEKRHMRLGRLREFRRGMVLMTILGPCKALEQPNDSTHFQ